MLALAAGSLTAGSAAVAQDDLRWIFDAAPPDFASLLYALPESDFIALGFDCVAGRDGIGINFDHRPVGATDGMTIFMELFSAVGQLSVTATGYTLELSDAFILSATTPIGGPLLTILSGGQVLSIMVQDGVDEFPLPDIEALTAFAEACETIF